MLKRRLATAPDRRGVTNTHTASPAQEGDMVDHPEYGKCVVQSAGRTALLIRPDGGLEAVLATELVILRRARDGEKEVLEGLTREQLAVLDDNLFKKGNWLRIPRDLGPILQRLAGERHITTEALLLFVGELLYLSRVQAQRKKPRKVMDKGWAWFRCSPQDVTAHYGLSADKPKRLLQVLKAHGYLWVWRKPYGHKRRCVMLNYLKFKRELRDYAAAQTQHTASE